MWYVVVTTTDSMCVDNVKTFAQCFLFALETSMTIGYGGRAITAKCPHAIVLLIVQALTSCLIDCSIIGLIFTKISRPGKREGTIAFSQNAVITKRDDKFVFMFRVADMRKRQLNECHVRAYLYRSYKTLEGHIVRHHQDQLRVGCDWCNIRDDSDRLYLLFPSTVCHVIDRKSPFYNVTPGMLSKSDWEIVAIVEGIVDATGSTVQARTSYLPSEVMWGYDFVDMVRFFHFSFFAVLDQDFR